jgi:hypothetical protein
MRTKYHFSTVLAAIGLAIGAFGFGAAPAAAGNGSCFRPFFVLVL